MCEYIVKTDDKIKIFYHQKNDGIFQMSANCGGLSKSRCICRDGESNFFVYCDVNNIIRMITVSKENTLIYMINKDDEWRRFEICTLPNDIKIYKIMIGLSKIGENLFCSAKYHGEFILIHSVLGNNAMPSTIDRLQDSWFFINEGRVYYQNAENIIGFRDFSDSKPDRFFKICTGKTPYVARIFDKNYLIYIKDSNIYVNDKPYIKDNNSSFPIFITKNNTPVLAWKNGNLIKSTAYNEKEKNSIKTVTFGKTPTTYILSNGRKNNFYYGTLLHDGLKLFECEDFFTKSKDKENEEQYKKEIEHIKKLLYKQKEDIKHYRDEINKLNEIISNLSFGLDDKQ